MAMQNRGKYPEPPAPGPIRAESVPEAYRIQDLLRHRCSIKRTIDTGEIRHIAGADAAYSGDKIFAAVVVLTFPGLKPVETACSMQEIPFPYIPGLLSFREGPAIVDAWSRLKTLPDVLFVNGHGYAHPKRFGIASHLGVVLDIPSVGVAQHLLTGTAEMPCPDKGSATPIIDENEIIGMAVRTVTGSKPVFVSVGHRADLAQAVDLALRTASRHRLTEPIRQADRLANQCRNEQAGTGT
ncbi:MAG: Endonuclease V [Methanoregula sp. PtaU1.Bin051]|nr:MAG: Endonuclease V [Methanoregula sp. PtaU1.Bin051]